jgi:hypothetical protein
MLTPMSKKHNPPPGTTAVVVGQPFPVTGPFGVDKHGCGASVRYEVIAGHHFFIASMPRLRPEEIQAWRRGAAHFALLKAQPLIFFSFRIEGVLDWSEAPFSIHRVPAGDRAPILAEPAAGRHQVVTLVLLDEGAIVRGLRQATYSKHASEVIIQTLRMAEKAPALAIEDEAALMGKLQATYSGPQMAQTFGVLTERLGVNQ